MRPITISASSVVYPHDVEGVDDVVRDSAVQDYLHATGVERVHVADDNHAAPELAAEAVKGIAETRELDDVGALLYAWTHYQGHDFWSPAHFVANEVGLRDGTITGIQQMCNGAGVALELAMGLLQSGRSDSAVIATGDAFRAPMFDRWTGDGNIVYGDSGTAMLVETATPEELTDDDHIVLAHVEAPIPALEGLHRGADPFSTYPQQYRATLDVRATKKSFLEDFGGSRVQEEMTSATERATHQALDAAGLSDRLSTVSYVALPRLGTEITKNSYAPAITWETNVASELARHSGHLGAGDLVANINDCVTRKLIPAGDAALFISAGAGFTISATVVGRGKTWTSK